MQQNFIDELEKRGKENIKEKNDKISKLLQRTDELTLKNSSKQDDIKSLQEEQEKVMGAGDKLLKLNNLKGKISNKVSRTTKEHEFFKQNVVCPTCTQDIEEDFRINKIEDAQYKVKELQSG